MATQTQQLAGSGSRSWSHGAIAGLIAGMVFAMWAMVVGALTPGSNLFAAPQGIAQSIGIGSPGHSIQALPLIVGLMGHMMNSVIFGLIFFFIVSRLGLTGVTSVIAGMAFGAMVYAGMYWVVLRGLLAGSSGSFISANPEWSWVMGHLMFGVVLGALLAYGPLALARKDH